jgi:ethanolamine utilization protein EutQ
MPTLIPQPTRIQSAGNKPKRIDEYVGRVNSRTSSASVAHMRSPSPDGSSRARLLPSTNSPSCSMACFASNTRAGSLDVAAGQAVIAHAGEWIRYSTPHEDGAEYIAVCLPAFSMETVHRDPS